VTNGGSIGMIEVIGWLWNCSLGGMAPQMSPARRIAVDPVPKIGASLLPDEIWLRLREALGLSDRELQIVREIFEDQKQESIAVRLGISSRNVTVNLQSIYGKLGIASRPQLIMRVMSEYLVFLASKN
jgi:DNA-binding CsgD family transcriptional regulator